MKLIYAAYYNSDMTEGRGPMVLDIAFEDKAVADAYIDSKPGIMGRKEKWSEEGSGKDWMTKPIFVYKTIEEAKSANDEKDKLRALGKLTQREKALLGITE
jgi:hypothetical protein